MKTFSNGDITVTGALKVTATNANDPSKSVTINVSGPLFVFASDGTTLVKLTGSSFGPLPLALSTVYFAHGQIVIDTTTGNAVKVTGTTSDLCAALS